MYLTALTELRITPQKALFIDDNVNNCLGAVKIGINAVLLCRNKKRFILQKILSVSKGYRVIYSLKELI
jgi:putative hydrolase of the HAD superfamily